MITHTPKTGEEFLALPATRLVETYTETDENGQTISIPYIQQLEAYYAGDDAVIMAQDSDGQTWRLAKLRDKGFVRIRD